MIFFHTCLHCNTLQHTATHCNTRCVAYIVQDSLSCLSALQHAATHSFMSVCTATRCNTLQHSATRSVVHTWYTIVFHVFWYLFEWFVDVKRHDSLSCLSALQHMPLRTATHIISEHFCVTLIISMWHSVTLIPKRHMVPVIWYLYKVHPDLYSPRKFKDFHHTLGGPQPKRVRLAHSWAVVTVTWFPSCHKNSKTVTLTQTQTQIWKTTVYHYVPEGLGYRFVMSVTQKWWVSHRNKCDIEMISGTQKWFFTGVVTWRKLCDAQKWMWHRHDECHSEMMSYWVCHVTGIMWRTEMSNSASSERRSSRVMPRRNESRDMTHFCVMSRDSLLRHMAHVTPRRAMQSQMCHSDTFGIAFGIIWRDMSHATQQWNEPCDAKCVILRRLSVIYSQFNLTCRPLVGTKRLVYSSMQSSPPVVLTHTHAHIHTDTHTHTHARTHTHTLPEHCVESPAFGVVQYNKHTHTQTHTYTSTLISAECKVARA